MKPHIAQTLSDLRAEQFKLQSMIDVIEAYGRATADEAGTTEGSDAPAGANPQPATCPPRKPAENRKRAKGETSYAVRPGRGVLAPLLRAIWGAKPGWEFTVAELSEIVRNKREVRSLTHIPMRVGVACCNATENGHLVRLSHGRGARFKVPQTVAKQYSEYKESLPKPQSAEE